MANNQDERVAELQAEVERLREQRDHARHRWDEFKRLAELTASDLNDSEAKIERLLETLGQANGCRCPTCLAVAALNDEG